MEAVQKPGRVRNAAYDDYRIYKIQTVTMVTPLTNSMKHRPGQDERPKKKGASFGSIFKKAMEQLPEGSTVDFLA